MGFSKPSVPPLAPEQVYELPYLERIKILSRYWAEEGFGSPKIFHVIYIAKLLFLYMLGGYLIGTLTSGFNPFHPGGFWNEPVLYQKFILWTVLLEVLGIAGSWGPLAGHFKPFTGGWRTYGRVDTIREPPWRMPLTGGDRRTRADVALYLAIIVTLVLSLVLPSVDDSGLTAHGFTGGRVSPALMIVLGVLLIALGLRDKVFFLQARGEQYLPAIVFFSLYGAVDMIVALKLLIVVVWVGAGFSKFGKHFGMVVPPMVSNTPWVPLKAMKRINYRKFPEDLRPSHAGNLLAHVGGTFVEIVVPLTLLFSTNKTVTIIAAVVMICFHAFITSTFPLAVPLEWNVLFAFAAGFLFLGNPNWDGFGLGDMTPWLLVVTAAALLFFPVLGNLRPDLVSFLPSMRQYAGNWASATWAFAPGAEQRLNERLVKPAPMIIDQVTELLGSREVAELAMYQVMGWRSLHSQGRALNSILLDQLGEDLNHYAIREAEFMTNCIVGFNFGDGHLHDHKFIASIQKRCQFAPGEFIVAWIESQPVNKNYQRYLVIDAALGIVERGTYLVDDAVAEQPWLPNGSIPLTVEWRLEGYERTSYPRVQPTSPDTAGAS
ncbi:DUF3556 domain-containing protein [Kribbella kalugense]|uniref:Transmembrane protein DUF3556 n=1 Tax=Kribbella kalugense TaxID=2512221 RepID=A0A4R7ZV16_9ACTN|nr:DUF3556 domain-containing protein [Kribbella kalugense]TDW21937.1 transmembrane protein DUF3556 [Kribbella kalugense]